MEVLVLSRVSDEITSKKWGLNLVLRLQKKQIIAAQLFSACHSENRQMSYFAHSGLVMTSREWLCSFFCDCQCHSWLPIWSEVKQTEQTAGAISLPQPLGVSIYTHAPAHSTTDWCLSGTNMCMLICWSTHQLFTVQWESADKPTYALNMSSSD